MHEWLLRSIQAELEEYLPDPYLDICRMLRDGEAFAFSRFGDGEFAAVFGMEGANADGHPFYPDLGARLREIVERNPDYIMGLQVRALFAHGVVPIRRLAPDVDWVLADSLHSASMEGRLEQFFGALAGREVLLVGPEHLQELSASRRWAHVLVPARNCWEHYSNVLERLQGSASGEELVVLFAASMMSNVLIDDMHTLNPGNTYIDVGSLLDPYGGVLSRDYHREMAGDPLQGIPS